MTSEQSVPLFPLNTVLYPGGPLPLRIFEPRYLDMVADRMKHGAPFGVCLIDSGTEAGQAARPHAVGTLARIVDWNQYSDGLLGITALGESRFRILATEIRPDQLLVGEVEPVADEPPLPLPSTHELLADLVRTYVERSGPLFEFVTTRYDDASWIGYRLAELLPIPMRQKQNLLELSDAGQRLEILEDAVRQLAEASARTSRE